MKRRRAVVVLVGALLGVPGAVVAEGASAVGWSAAVVSDVHFLAPGLHDDGERYRRFLAGGDNKNLAAVPALVDALVASFSQAGAPRCLIVTGDLTVNGEAASHQALADRLRPLVKAGVPVYVVPGNHDLNNPSASRFVADHVEPVASASSDDFARIWADFGFSAALDRDPSSLGYVVQAAPGLRLLLLDSTVSDQNDLLGYSVTGGALGEATWAWIDRVAARARASGNRLVAAMHHSLVDHNSVVHDGYTIDDAGVVADRLAAAGVSLVLTGHTHVQDVAEASTAHGLVNDVSSGSLAVFPHLVGRVGLEAGGLTYSVATLAPAVPGGPALAEAFFRDRSARMFEGLVASSGGDRLSAGERAELTNLLVDFNERFFGAYGRTDTGPQAAQRLEALLGRLTPGFLTAYGRSLRGDETPLSVADQAGRLVFAAGPGLSSVPWLGSSWKAAPPATGGTGSFLTSTSPGTRGRAGSSPAPMGPESRPWRPSGSVTSTWSPVAWSGTPGSPWPPRRGSASSANASSSTGNGTSTSPT